MAAIPRIRDGDVAIAAVVSLGAVIAFDVFPILALGFALLAGGFGLALARRGKPAGRRLLAIFAGMVLGAIIIATLVATRH
jgi:hypothetical protein